MRIFMRDTHGHINFKLSFGEVFPGYLEQMVGHVDAEIEQQDPEDAIGAPALRLLILGNLQLRHQAWSHKRRPCQPTNFSARRNASLETDGREAEQRRRLTWTLHPASEQAAPDSGGDGDVVAKGAGGERGRLGGEGLRVGSGRRGQEEQQLLRHG